MVKTVVVAGIPGTGKTTICDMVKEFAGNVGLNVEVINYGTVMVELLRESGESVKRDDIRKMDVDLQREVQMRAAEAISERLKRANGLTVIDTHMLVKTAEGYLPGLPQRVLELLKPEMLVLIEAQPSEIRSRRAKDSVRARDEEVEEAIRDELLLSRAMASACATLMGVPVKIIVNADGKQEEAAREVLKALGVK